MKTGISEFTFGYAFLFEQTRRHWADLLAAPLLPSLQQEAEDGWDARLPTRGTIFFYQFKLSDYLRTGNAKYIRDGTYVGAYYRISLHRRDGNNQHRRLRSLSRRHPDTYYVAPEFTGLTTFNTSFLAGRIALDSRLIPLKECRDYHDSEQHYITYQPGDPRWIEHSEPRRHRASARGSEIEGLYRASREDWRAIDLTFAQEWYSQLREELSADEGRAATDEVTAQLIEREVPLEDRGALLVAAAELVAAHYGATAMLVGTRQGDGNERTARNGR